ncbi:helix-turn-helix domain-containing protein [Bacillus sp. SCS-151]|uniref:helix-turn-helix domain-containing protein n=1 Tax=Nanhaiella sioensis TaxID=3115293 RepID=UPI003978FD38
MIYNVTPRLNEVLQKRDMSYTQLSELTNIPVEKLLQFDTRKSHQDTSLVAISQALEISIEELFIIAPIKKVKKRKQS